MTGYYVRIQRGAGSWESVDIADLTDAELDAYAAAEPELGWDWAEALASWIEARVDLGAADRRELDRFTHGPRDRREGWIAARALVGLIRDHVRPAPIPISILIPEEEPPDARP
jgi:hypothetical protein